MAIVEWVVTNPPAFAVTWGISFLDQQNNIVAGPTVAPIAQQLTLNIPNGSVGFFSLGFFDAAPISQQEFRRLPAAGFVEVVGDASNTFDFGGGGAGGGFGGIGDLLLIAAVGFAFTGRKKSRR